MFLNVVNRLSNNENVATKCLNIHCRLTERRRSDMYSCELHTYLPFMLSDCLSKYPQESALYNKSVSIFILNHKSGAVARFRCTNTGYLLTPCIHFCVIKLLRSSESGLGGTAKVIRHRDYWRQDDLLLEPPFLRAWSACSGLQGISQLACLGSWRLYVWHRLPSAAPTLRYIADGRHLCKKSLACFGVQPPPHEDWGSLAHSISRKVCQPPSIRRWEVCLTGSGG